MERLFHVIFVIGRHLQCLPLSIIHPAPFNKEACKTFGFAIHGKSTIFGSSKSLEK
jgi:hypothetical protein